MACPIDAVDRRDDLRLVAIAPKLDDRVESERRSAGRPPALYRLHGFGHGRAVGHEGRPLEALRLGHLGIGLLDAVPLFRRLGGGMEGFELSGDARLGAVCHRRLAEDA